MEPPVSFDRVADEYDRSRRLPAPLQTFAVDTLTSLVGRGSILEPGVGTGRILAPLHKSGVRVVGCDVSSKMLGHARRKGVPALLLADIRQLPFRDRSFEWSMTNHLLHLVRDWPSALRELGRVTRESYASILLREKEWPDLSREYHRTTERAGFRTKAPGLRERALPRLLRPDRQWAGPSIVQTVEAEELLAQLDRRSMSSQWKVPASVHRKAMKPLWDRYPGRSIRQRVSVQVAVWEIGRLTEFAERQARRWPSLARPARRSLVRVGRRRAEKARR